jgi:hypothetical protein
MEYFMEEWVAEFLKSEIQYESVPALLMLERRAGYHWKELLEALMTN